MISINALVSAYKKASTAADLLPSDRKATLPEFFHGLYRASRTMLVLTATAKVVVTYQWFPPESWLATKLADALVVAVVVYLLFVALVVVKYCKRTFWP